MRDDLICRIRDDYFSHARKRKVSWAAAFGPIDSIIRDNGEVNESTRVGRSLRFAGIKVSMNGSRTVYSGETVVRKLSLTFGK